MLVPAISHGEELWHTAYCSHGPAVLAFLQRRLERREEAEDLLQETFVRAMRTGTFSPADGNARAYLLSTARNLVLNHRRRPRLVVPAHSAEDSLADLPAAAASPEAAAAWSAFRRRLRRVLDQLRPDHRRAFELAILEQHSYREIAELTGWSPSQVKINVYRARQRVIAELGEFLPPGGGP